MNVTQVPLQVFIKRHKISIRMIRQKVKVKVTPEKAMKTQRGSRGVVQLFL
jgi:hypothetical protein